MNKEHLLYETPEVRTFVVRVEGVICGSPLYGIQGSAGADLDYNDYGVDF